VSDVPNGSGYGAHGGTTVVGTFTPVSTLFSVFLRVFSTLFWTLIPRSPVMIQHV
jgi:hypothetical protein